MITIHGLGLAVAAGIGIVVGLRVLGFFTDVSISLYAALLRIALIGLAVNTISGVALFTTQATYFIVHPAFQIKIAAIVLAVTAALLLRRPMQAAARGEVVSEGKRRTLAAMSITLWCVAIVAGRLIAYV